MKGLAKGLGLNKEDKWKYREVNRLARVWLLLAFISSGCGYFLAFQWEGRAVDPEKLRTFVGEVTDIFCPKKAGGDQYIAIEFKTASGLIKGARIPPSKEVCDSEYKVNLISSEARVEYFGNLSIVVLLKGSVAKGLEVGVKNYRTTVLFFSFVFVVFAVVFLTLGLRKPKTLNSR